MALMVSVSALAAATALAEINPEGVRKIESTPGLVAFWTFGEPPGSPRRSQGTPEAHPLEEVGGPIARLDEGPLSGCSVHLNGRQYLRLPYARTGDLNISGPQAQVSMIALVRLDALQRGVTIAGMWFEGKGAFDDSGSRQYALLLNMPAYGGTRQVTPHVSAEGGVTRRHDGTPLPWCVDYAASRSTVPTGRWVSLGFTYDARFLKAFFNGVMEERPVQPEPDRRTDPYFTQEGPDGGHRGVNPYYHGRGIFSFDPARHAESKPQGGADFTVGARFAVGSILSETLSGSIGGLAVFNRALTDTEMAQLHEAARLERLNP